MTMRLKHLLLPLFLLAITFASHAQADTTEPVHIINAKNLYWKKISETTELQILSGNVHMRQGKADFFCDSCVLNNEGKIFEAFGNVRIVDSDTARTRSDFLRYMIDTKMAYLTGNVSLTDGHATLHTNTLDYDVANKIGTYRDGGRVVNKKSVLTSREGIYYTDLRDIYFRGNVELKDPAYYLKTDSLLYNTESQIARFIADTYIQDSSKRVINTREGFYDVANSRAEFFSRTTVQDGSMTASADNMVSDDERKIVQLEGRAVVRDTAQGYVVLADKIGVDRNNDAMLATRKPLMIIKQDEDSIYVTGDTLFTARLTALYRNDSAMLKQLNLEEKDSANRYFEAFRNVRVFSDSVQSVSDSLFYSFKDSIFQLFYDPIVWTRNSQLTGDTIFLYTKNKKADRARVWENSFMISEIEPGVYNQVMSNRMDAYFTEGKIDSVRARGMAESVYFLQDEDSAYTGVNQTSSDVIDVYFENGEVQRAVFRSNLKGTLYPITQKRPEEMRLTRFRWLIHLRPKTKYELFE